MSSLLTIDIGGTRSRVGFTDLDEDDRGFTMEAVYRNADFSGIEEVIAAFCGANSVEAEFACLAVAGIVEDTVVDMTNLAWRIDAKVLQGRFSFKKVWLLNDMAALANVVPYLQDDEVTEIHGGKKRKGETIAVIAPGTGLGQGYLVDSGGRYVVKSSEGGHATFAPANEEELELYRWLLESNDVVSAEHLCAGPGLTLLYRFYAEKGEITPADWVAKRATSEKDLAPLIVEGATAAEPCLLCAHIINRYLRLLGSESANLALKLYARGGVYIGGGVILHLLGRVSLQPFIQTFLGTGKMADLLAEIPVYVITKEHANLHGAMRYARGRF